MADTSTKATKDTKAAGDVPPAELTVEERLDRLEAAVGVHPADTPDQVVPEGAPAVLYAPADEDDE